jgi:hypothetical protein
MRPKTPFARASATSSIPSAGRPQDIESAQGENRARILAMASSVADKSRGGKFGIFDADFIVLAMIKA